MTLKLSDVKILNFIEHVLIKIISLKINCVNYKKNA